MTRDASRTTRVAQLDVAAYTIPTDAPEADGTIAWDATTIVIVHAHAGGTRGLGYSYTHEAAATLIARTLAGVVCGSDAMDIPAAWDAMVRAVRNIGRPGLASSAIAAVDIALWDLKARLLDVSLVTLLGQVRESVAAYGSGGFTTYTIERLQAQLAAWVRDGMASVKMKVGSHPARDVERVRAARDAIGPSASLYVDANGAYSRTQALAFAEWFGDLGVTWFEEPVIASDLAGLRLLRDRAPAGMDIAAGEYSYEPADVRRMLEAGAVDVVQADATRCEGITGFLRAASLCEAHALPLSAHTAPSLHAHPCCAVTPARNVEYFHDHVRIEHLLFDGALTPTGGALRPDASRPGLGLTLKHADAAPYAI